MIANTGCPTGGARPDSPSTVGQEKLDQYADAGIALAGFPVYSGTEQLPERVEFEWKNLNTAYAVPYSQWAYYVVHAPYRDVAAFYKSKSIAPPFANISLYWKETDRGVLGAWFQEASADKYARIWFIPNPDDDGKSYLIIMRNNDIGSCSIF